jgi:uncharacterized protein (DUF1800 family)
VTERQVAHIWRRLGFGATAADLDHGVGVGPTALINDLLTRKLTTPAQWFLPAVDTWQGQVAYLGRQFGLMSSSPNPLQERLAWTLQGLVVVGLVDSVGFADYRTYIARLRSNPMGSYTQLLRDTAKTTAMLQYLNGDQNSADHPNQNYSRELMELFSLGLKNLVTGAQNYTQNDVVQIARALTGWTYDYSSDTVIWDPTKFDGGSKTFFGVNHGNAGTWQVITSVSNHPAYRYFVPARLHRELTGLVPSTATLKTLGALWGNTGNVHAVVEAIVKSPTFLSPASIGSKVKTPVELMVSGARVMQFKLGPTDYGWQLSTFMNQHPLYPPNVSGWPSGKIWLNSGVTMAWGSIVQDFASASLSDPKGTAAQLFSKAGKAGAPGVAVHLCGLSEVSTVTMKALSAYANSAPWTLERAAGLLALVLVSPEFAVN